MSKHSPQPPSTLLGPPHLTPPRLASPRLASSPHKHIHTTHSKCCEIPLRSFLRGGNIYFPWLCVRAKRYAKSMHEALNVLTWGFQRNHSSQPQRRCGKKNTLASTRIFPRLATRGPPYLDDNGLDSIPSYLSLPSPLGQSGDCRAREFLLACRLTFASTCLNCPIYLCAPGLASH